MSSLFSLPEKVNGSNLETFIDKYEHHYDRLRNLVAASKFEEYNSHFLLFLDSDRAKRDFLLTSLSKKYPNVVDNLTTKDSLKFEEVKDKLFSLHADSMLSPTLIEPQGAAALMAQGLGKKFDKFNKLNRIQKNQGGNRAIRNGTTVQATTQSTNKAFGSPITRTRNKAIRLYSTTAGNQSTCNYCKQNGHHFTGHTDKVCFRQKTTTEELPKAHAFVTQQVCSSSNEWKFDTGASTNMSSDIDQFAELQRHSSIVSIGNSIPLNSTGIGTVHLQCLIDSQEYLLTLNNVWYVPGLGHNLVSWNVLQRSGYTMSGNGNDIIIMLEGKPKFKASFGEGNLPCIELVTDNNKAFSYLAEASDLNSYTWWHRALGHPASIDCSLYPNDINIIKPKDFFCEACVLGKSIHHTPKPSKDRSTRAFQLIHSDLSGQMAVKSYGGSEYYISFIDDFTRMVWVAFLKQKSDAPNTILHFIARIKNQFNTKILCFHTDNGTEYVNSKVAAFFLKQGIQHSLMPLYIHEYNGIAERFNRTIQTMMRTMLNSQKDLDLKLWAEACHTAVYLKNRLPHSALNGLTPYEILYNKKPVISHLQPFGVTCYIYIPPEKRGAGSKLKARAEKGIFVGYTDSMELYKVQLPSGHIMV